MLINVLKGLEQRQLLYRALGNTVWQISDKVLRLGMGLVVGVWVARFLGPAQFGLLNYAIAFVALFSALADGGMQSVIVRELIQRKSQRLVIVSSALALRVTAAIGVTGVALVSIRLLRANDLDSILIVTIVSLTLLPQAWDVIDFDYQSRLESRPIVITRGASFISFSVLKVVLIVIRADLIWFVWAVVGEAALAAIVMRCLPAGRKFKLFRAVSWKEIKHLIVVCWPMTVAGLSVMLYMRIDQLMLGQMLGNGEVGIFSAAVRISESWYFVPISVVSAIAPALIQNLQESSERYRENLLKLMKVLLWLSVGVATVLSFEARRLVALLYGPSYAAAGPVLVIHGWAGLFVSLGIAAGPWFINSGLLWYRMSQTMAGAFVNIVMNVFLIPRYGVVGAAWSTLASQAVSACLFNAFSRTTWPVFLLQARAILLR